jgi:hypothetical protein
VPGGRQSAALVDGGISKLIGKIEELAKQPRG